MEPVNGECTKKAYESRLEARTALLLMWKKGRPERASYRCSDCGAWHLTKKRRRAP
ncbi:hypothetical protein ACGF5F_29790 [Streptomyces sp. NPDC047821]|uniref:hypothetical protein n=1 Tax=Streptomyces sp. NPDC047821 TaxID=3365488 RepID=UPI00371EA86A